MEPTPQPNPPAPTPTAGNPVVEYVRANRQTAGMILGGLSVVFLGLAIFLAVKAYGTTTAEPEKTPAEKSFDPRRPEPPKSPVEIANLRQNDYTPSATEAHELTTLYLERFRGRPLAMVVARLVEPDELEVGAVLEGDEAVVGADARVPAARDDGESQGRVVLRGGLEAVDGDHQMIDAEEHQRPPNAGATSLTKRANWPCWFQEVSRSAMWPRPASKYARSWATQSFGGPATVHCSTNLALKLDV